MRTVLLIALCLISGECHQNFTRVTGQLGTSVIITCVYPNNYTDHGKIFCVSMGSRCGTLVSTDRNATEAKRGRYSLVYNREERALKVTIDGLMENDTAMYWCAARTGLERSYRTTRVIAVVLHVSPVTVDVGGSADFRCPYERDLESSPKHFYRGEHSHNAPLHQRAVLIQSNQSNILVTQGRFSLYDNTKSRVFTVTISNLTSEDSGKYWCAVKRKNMNDILTDYLLFVQGGVDNLQGAMSVTGMKLLLSLSVIFIFFITFITIIILMWRRKTSKGPSPLPGNRRCADQSEEKASHPDEVDLRCEESFYSLVQLPIPN